MVVPCAVLPTDCSGWPASCFNGECYSTPTMVRQQRRRSQRSLSSTGTDIPSSRPTFGRAPRASAVREAAQRHWRQPARNVLDSGSTVLRSTGREGAPHASKRRCFAKHSNLITGRKSHLGRKPREVSGDAGFATEANLASLKERRIKAYLPPGRARHGEAHAAGRRKLTKMPLMRAMAETLKRAGRRSRYRLRKQVVEPVFGQIKQARSFRQFLLRGLDQVRGEWAMICTAHNLLKLAQAAGR